MHQESISVVCKIYEWDADYTCFYSNIYIQSPVLNDELCCIYGFDISEQFYGCSIAVQKVHDLRYTCDYDFTSDIEYIGLNGCDEYCNNQCIDTISNIFSHSICNFAMDKERIRNEFVCLSAMATGI